MNIYLIIFIIYGAVFVGILLGQLTSDYDQLWHYKNILLVLMWPALFVLILLMITKLLWYLVPVHLVYKYTIRWGEVLSFETKDDKYGVIKTEFGAFLYKKIDKSNKQTKFIKRYNIYKRMVFIPMLIYILYIKLNYESLILELKDNSMIYLKVTKIGKNVWMMLP